jgi:hypothetical protein
VSLVGQPSTLTTLRSTYGVSGESPYTHCQVHPLGPAALAGGGDDAELGMAGISLDVACTDGLSTDVGVSSRLAGVPSTEMYLEEVGEFPLVAVFVQAKYDPF